MAFSTEERAALLSRVRYELGYSAVAVSGEPYIDWTLLPDTAVDNLTSGASTTTSTAVTDTTIPTTITLTSATGFAAGLRIHVDVGVQREVVIAQSLSGTSLAARFSKTHTGTYPVEVDCGESILRTILGRLDSLHIKIDSAASTGGLKQVDEVHFFEGGAHLVELHKERDRWRGELAALLKLPWNNKPGGSGRLEAY